MTDDETPHHGLNVPSAGRTNWHEPLNENFEQLDREVMLSGPYDDMPDPAEGDPEPHDGAKYHATDVNAVFVWQAEDPDGGGGDDAGDVDGEWTVLNSGTADEPVPGTTHLESLETTESVTVDGSQTHVAYGDEADELGDQSVTVGMGAKANTLGSVSIGRSAGKYGDGEGAVSIGRNAGLHNTRYSVAIGWEAMSESEADRAIAIGAHAGRKAENAGTENTSRSQFIGYRAGEECTGERNSIIGQFAGRYMTGHWNVALGYRAGRDSAAERGCHLGYRAGQHFADEMGPIAVGVRAGQFQRGEELVAIGYHALRGKNDGAGGDGSVAVGYAAGEENEGNRCTFLGRRAGRYNRGDDVIALGNRAAAENEEDNVFLVHDSEGDVAMKLDMDDGDLRIPGELEEGAEL